MALSCPRCGTDVPNEALYCPYCSLPKPKRGFVEAQDEPALAGASATPYEQPQPVVHKPRRSVHRSSARTERPVKSVKRSPSRPAKPPRNLRVPVVSVAALAALLCVGLYIFIVPLVYSETAE